MVIGFNEVCARHDLARFVKGYLGNVVGAVFGVVLGGFFFEGYEGLG